MHACWRTPIIFEHLKTFLAFSENIFYIFHKHNVSSAMNLHLSSVENDRRIQSKFIYLETMLSRLTDTRQ